MSGDTAWPLIGHASAEADFLSAFDSGRLHHAWLVEGPSGIGKSLLVKRLAAFLLGARGAEDTLLDAPSNDNVVQKLNADAHPDLRWLTRRPDDKGKLKQDIPVDDIRSLNKFFSLKSGLGGWRVGVIDALDELNRSGSNAMLKTLEEPPANVVLFLISHGTRPVLPTIRSRCRRLRLARLSDDETQTVLSGLDDETAGQAAGLAHGRPGYGLELASSQGLAAANAARTLIGAIGKPGDRHVSEAIQSAGIDSAAYAAFNNEILAWLSDNAAAKDHYADAWLGISRLAAEVSELNMDRTQAAAKLVSMLQSASQVR